LAPLMRLSVTTKGQLPNAWQALQDLKSTPGKFGQMAHSTCRCDNNLNCALLFGGICIQRLKVVLSLRLVDTERSVGRDLLAHAMRGCSMKGKSTIYGIPSSRGYERARTHAR